MSEQEKIPPLDLSTEIDLLWDDLNAAIQDVLRSGNFIMGPQVKSLEKELAGYLGVRHAISLNSGTDALLIGLLSLGIGEGDEVITTPFSFFATAEVCDLIGATPVFVDIDPVTFNLRPDLIVDRINSNTRAILPVHLFGNAADMDSIQKIAQEHGLFILEDAAQGFGAEYRGRKLGTLGNMGAFSFYPTKNLGAYGDGGLLVTDDDSLAETARTLRVHGAREKYHNERLGYNSRLDTIQAAILSVKLPYIDQWNEARRQAAKRYDSYLADLPGLTPPTATPGAYHIYHQYTVSIDAGRRDMVHEVLKEAGIYTMIYYPVPLHQLPVYESRNIQLPQAEQTAQEVLSLPIWPHIRENQQQRIAEALRSALK